ncbi:permease [Cohnella panacarvi]|uniref:permease n=1 Tax=Cohnella panacarvi TaxID=400776 RepID=UPI000479A9ED|nr:permease [Cohnella panacarvi]
MKTTVLPDSWKVHAAFVIAFGTIILFVFQPTILTDMLATSESGIHTFKTMLISIFLEAMPFLLLGVIVSSFMHAFIPESWFRQWIPKNPVLGVMVACLLGIVFPLCECGMIPIVRRLVAKGMPLYVGIVFILVGPIVNPIVFSATFAAFRSKPEMVYSRMGLAVAVGLVIGLAVYYFVKSTPLKQNRSSSLLAVHTHPHHHSHDHSTPRSRRNKFLEMFEHAGAEFFDMGKYLILGSLITAAVQAFVPRSEIVGIGQGDISSHLFMMGFAFILSLCSTSDAFVASTFASTFSMSSLLTFLVFGPMLDFKNTLMLLSVFKAKFVLYLAVGIAVTVLVGSWILGSMVWG